MRCSRRSDKQRVWPVDSPVRGDRQGFLIHGQRVQVRSAAVHYPRIPPGEWEDVLWKIKMAGFNCVETYLFWNFHERQEGQFDFSGEADLDRFLSLIGQHGLHAIIRIGPYACAEWALGGLPPYLLGKPGIRFRTYNRAYLDAVARYLEAAAPILRKQSLHQGGPIILVQIENEYQAVQKRYGEAGRKYLAWLKAEVAGMKLGLPLITCAGAVEGCLECINHFYPDRVFRDFQETHPGSPVFVTEAWVNWYDTWMKPHHDRDADEYRCRLLSFMEQGGAGFNIYMGAGGTNFGCWGMYAQTTSYDFNAPVGEGGRLSRNYYQLKLMNQVLETIAPELLSGKVRETLYFLDRTFARGGRRSYWPILYRYPADGRIVIRDAPLVPFARVTRGGRQELLCFPATDRAEVVVHWQVAGGAEQSRVMQCPKPGRPEKLVLSSQLAIWVYAESDAEVTWVLGDRVVTGCALPRPDRQGLWLRRSDERRPVPSNASAVHLSPSVFRAAAPRPPHLRWQAARFTEWRALQTNWDQGKPVGAVHNMISDIGLDTDYGWYWTSWRSPSAGYRSLVLPRLMDGAVVLVNGKFCNHLLPSKENRDRWSDFAFQTDIPVKKGVNQLALLVFSLGLIKGDWMLPTGMEGEWKGIARPVLLEGRPLKWRFHAGLFGGPRTEMAWQIPSPGGRGPLWCRACFNWQPVDDQQLLGWRPEGLCRGFLWLNGKPLGRYWNAPYLKHPEDDPPERGITNFGPCSYDRSRPVTQTDYYLPRSWLLPQNELWVFEETGAMPTLSCLITDNDGVTVPFQTKKKR